MPIAMSREEWQRLVSWTDGSREGDATRQSEYVKRLNELSSAMTREWPNSLENVSKRNEELRRARHEVAEQANTKFYKKYLRNKRDERARMMYSARDTIFKNRDAPKMFLRAVIETCVQKERQAQLKFKAERQRDAAEQKRKDDEEITRHAVEWHALMEARRKRRLDINKQHQKEILDQAHEFAERSRKEHETELKYQKIDNMKANEQMDALRTFEKDLNKAEKARIFSDMEQAKAELDARRAEERARDQLDDQLIAVLQRSRARTQNMRKQTEKGIKEEQLRVLELNSRRLASGDAERDALERARRDAALREKEANAEEKVRKQREKEEGFRRERREARAQFLRDEAERLRELGTRRQWEMMNRFKNQELYSDYKEKQRLEKERKIKEFREDTLRLWKEREEREARERAETRYFYGELAERKLRDEDNKLLTHANELLAEAKRHGRPDHAIKAAIQRYCNLYRLYPMPELPASLQQHFPRSRPAARCAPEPGYTPAPPPQPAGRGAEPGVAKRSGLQSADNAGPSQPVAKKEETAADYKRAGRANGLQRRDDTPNMSGNIVLMLLVVSAVIMASAEEYYNCVPYGEQCFNSCVHCCPIKSSYVDAKIEFLEEGVCDYFGSGHCRLAKELKDEPTIEQYKALMMERASLKTPFSPCKDVNVFPPSFVHINPR